MSLLFLSPKRKFQVCCYFDKGEVPTSCNLHAKVFVNKRRRVFRCSFVRLGSPGWPLVDELRMIQLLLLRSFELLIKSINFR